MRRVLLITACFGLLTLMSAACAEVGDRVDGLRETADQVRDDVAGGSVADETAADDAASPAGFCLSLTRTATAIASGSPATAGEAAEEALARAPEGLAEDTRAVAEALRAAREDDGDGLRDRSVSDALDRLVAAASDLCDPR